MPEYIWFPDIHRYRDADTGRFISGAEVRNWSQFSMGESADEARGLAGTLGTGDLTVGQWEAAMRSQIKEEYIKQYLLGRGGRDQMTSADWGGVGGMLANQYRYLDGFAAEIAAGTLSEAQIAARSEMYMLSARQAFERANARARPADERIKWTLTPVENCSGCIEFASMGWQNVVDAPYGGAVPGSGSTPCLSRCHCFLQYRK